MSKGYDLTGKVFGRLTVLEITSEKNKGRNKMWKCKCECGKITYSTSSRLISGEKRSCACRSKVVRQPMEDCASYNKDRKRGCEALNEMLCVTKGKCKFYKPKEESNDEDKT